MSIGVNPGAWVTTPRFWDGGRGVSITLHEISLYPIMYAVQEYEIGTLY